MGCTYKTFDFQLNFELNFKNEIEERSFCIWCCSGLVLSSTITDAFLDQVLRILCFELNVSEKRVNRGALAKLYCS